MNNFTRNTAFDPKTRLQKEIDRNRENLDKIYDLARNKAIEDIPDDFSLLAGFGIISTLVGIGLVLIVIIF